MRKILLKLQQIASKINRIKKSLIKHFTLQNCYVNTLTTTKKKLWINCVSIKRF